MDLKSSNLTKLVLEENNFTSLSAISPLCNLPLLQSLYLGHNSINGRKGLRTPKSKEIEPRFPESLTYLDLSYNAIDNWDFINQLQYHFPGLTGLRVAHNPLYEDQDGNPSMGVDESFMLTLARLPGLNVLNFSNVRYTHSNRQRLCIPNLTMRPDHRARTDQRRDILPLTNRQGTRSSPRKRRGSSETKPSSIRGTLRT